MQGSDFAPQAPFQAVFQPAEASDGYGILTFSVYVESQSATAGPLPAEDIAAALRDFLATRGWTLQQFQGRPMDQPLDWPQEG